MHPHSATAMLSDQTAQRCMYMYTCICCNYGEYTIFALVYEL